VILVWGIAEDSTTAGVLGQLRQRRAEVVFLDQRRLLGPQLSTTELELDVTDGVRATLTRAGCRLELTRVSAAFVRPYDPRAFGDPVASGSGTATTARAVELDELLWSWADVTPARVINRPANMAANGSKPFQAERIRATGFAVPDTLVTTDPEAAQAFWLRHGDVIYKSISGIRSIVTRLRPQDRVRWTDLATCPVQFQQYVPGADHRVHVVGDEVFCARIDSDVDDYRYAHRQGGHARVVAVTLPPGLVERCRALSRAEGLAVSGIDLRRTPAGDWYCLEVNPSPAFSYFEPDDQPAPIAAAVADLLLAGPEAVETG